MMLDNQFFPTLYTLSLLCRCYLGLQVLLVHQVVLSHQLVPVLPEVHLVLKLQKKDKKDRVSLSTANEWQACNNSQTSI